MGRGKGRGRDEGKGKDDLGPEPPPELKS